MRKPIASSMALALLFLAAPACDENNPGGSGAPDLLTTPAPDAGGSTGSDAGTMTGSFDIGSGPYSLVYAGTAIGIDARTATKATLESEKLKAYTASAQEDPDRGTNQVVESGGEGPLVWGRWANGKTAGTYFNNTFTFPASGGLHYVIGKPAASIPMSGGGTWVIKGKTSATVSDGSLAPGMISGSIGVAFAGAATKIGVSLSLAIPGDATYTIDSTGGAANPATTQLKIFSQNFFTTDGQNPIKLTTGGACAAAGGTDCIAVVDGFIAGDSADYIGLVVHVFKGAGGAAKTVSGALIFKKQ